MVSKEVKKLEVLCKALETVNYQIKNLSPYYSYLQVRAWKARRKSIKNEIKFLRGMVKKQKQATPFKELLLF